MATVYLDNAATSHPKPGSVYQASDEFLRQGGSAGRSAHHLSLECARRVFETRLQVAQLLNVKSADRVVFTPGCTASINMVLKGRNWSAGDVVLVSALEHNAVMRPLSQLVSTRGIKVVALPYSPGQIVNPLQLRQHIKDLKPTLCVLQEASNVTGEMLDLHDVDEVCHASGTNLLIDAAQSAGLYHAAPGETSIAYWCASGHKGLLGAAGVGVLYVRADLELDPLVAGGTGSRSESITMPASYPDHLEAGTAPGPAIAALGAGVSWLLEHDRKLLRETEQCLVSEFIERVSRLDSVQVVAATPRQRTATVSFGVASLDASAIADSLDRDYGICVRSGLHCAPSAHRTLGTLERGLVRVSFGPFSSMADVDAIGQALVEILSKSK